MICHVVFLHFIATPGTYLLNAKYCWDRRVRVHKKYRVYATTLTSQRNFPLSLTLALLKLSSTIVADKMAAITTPTTG